jgi:hypothetical protein
MIERFLIYHPLRFDFHMRDFFEECIADHEATWEGLTDEEKHKYRPGLLWSVELEGKLEELIEQSSPALPDDFRENKAGWVEFISHLIDEYGDYRRHGQNIFHFQPQLLTLLTHSDVDALTFDRVKFPFKSFYLHFGRQSGLTIWDSDYVVDGAYIQDTTFRHADGRPDEPFLNVAFTTVNLKGNYAVKGDLASFLCGERHYTADLAFEGGVTVGEAVEGCIADEKESSYRYPVAASWFPFLPQLIRVVINCLCYLSYEERDVVLKFPDFTPRSLVEKLERSKTPKEIQRNESKLESQGFRRIYICGDTIEKTEKAMPTGKEVSTHWRRGHWRNQAYGTGLLLHQLLWIKPTLVRADKGDPQIKHLYNVRDRQVDDRV